MSMKNSNDTIRNRTRDLPGCRAVSQPNAPPRARLKIPIRLEHGVVWNGTYMELSKASSQKVGIFLSALWEPQTLEHSRLRFFFTQEVALTCCVHLAAGCKAGVNRLSVGRWLKMPPDSQRTGAVSRDTMQMSWPPKWGTQSVSPVCKADQTPKQLSLILLYFNVSTPASVQRTVFISPHVAGLCTPTKQAHLGTTNSKLPILAVVRINRQRQWKVNNVLWTA